MSVSDLTPEATMAVARILIAVEVALALLALIIAFIRACGPSIIKRGLSRSIAATAKFMHLPIYH